MNLSAPQISSGEGGEACVRNSGTDEETWVQVERIRCRWRGSGADGETRVQVKSLRGRWRSTGESGEAQAQVERLRYRRRERLR